MVLMAKGSLVANNQGEAPKSVPACVGRAGDSPENMGVAHGTLHMNFDRDIKFHAATFH
jgi:hypothetical protein